MSQEHDGQRAVAGPPKATPERLEDHKDPNYDMIDSEEDLARWPELEPVLRDCAEVILPAYQRADAAALYNQKRHKWLVFAAAICGMLAVLFAIVQLSPFSEQFSWVRMLEPIAAGLAAIAVVLGLVAAIFVKWLFEREKAERCRVLKFLYLISPGLWRDKTPEARQALLGDRVEPLTTSDRENLERWVKGENRVLGEASPAGAAALGNDAFEQFIEYYREKRLLYQKHYFDGQAKRRHFWERFTRTVPVGCFFLSIMAALGHFGVAEVWPEQDSVKLGMLMLAACLPVAGVAARTLHTAHEFSRNVLRFESISGELEQLAHELEAKTDPQAKLEVLHRVEDSLRAERLEWMRLMKEVEWFG